MESVVAALYDDFFDAQRAVRELRHSGFESKHINLIANDAPGIYSAHLKEVGDEVPVKTGDDMTEDTLEGAGIGAILGGLGGLLLGLTALGVPGIGPVLAAGPIAATLAGAGVGAAAGGLLGALTEAGIPEKQAHVYAEGVRRGGTLVMVTTSPELAEAAIEILNAHNPVDMRVRSQVWQDEEEWERFDPEDVPYKPEQIDADRVRFERALKEVRDELPYNPVGHYTPMRRFEDDELIFRNHYESEYVEPDLAYDTLRPAYLFGWQAASDQRFFDKDWSDIETDLERDWQRNHPDNVWDNVKDAVYTGWNTVRTRRSPQDDNP